MQNREPPPFNRPTMPPPPSSAPGYGPGPDAGYGTGPGAGYGQPPAPSGRRSRRRGSGGGGRPPGTSSRRPRKTSWLTWLGGGLIALILIFGLGIGTLLMIYSPTEIVRQELVSRVKAQTGRDLTLAGGAGLTFWPKIGVALRDVTLSAPPGMRAPPTLTARSISVRLAIGPLLSGKAVVESIAIDKPIIDLRKDRSGRASWTFAARPLSRPTRYAQAQPRGTITDSAEAIPPRPADATNLDALDRIELSEVQVFDATVTYTDEATGFSETVRAIDAKLTGQSLRDPVKLTGAANARGTRFNFDASVAAPRDVIAGGGTDVVLSVNSAPIRVSLKGKANPLGQTAFTGPVDIRVPNLNGLSRLAGLALPNATNLGAARIGGQLQVTNSNIRLTAADLGLGDTTVTGLIALNVAGARPKVTADVALNTLNVDAVVAGFEGARAVSPPREPAPAQRARPGAAPNSIDDILKRDGAPARTPEVRSYKARDGWSDETIDLNALRIVDVNAKVRAGLIQSSGLKVDSANARIAITRGATRVNLDRVVLYGGDASGILTLDPTARGAQVGSNVTANNITIRPLMLALAQFGDLDGRGNIQIAVASEGRSQRDLMGSLRGKGNIALKDGALIGWNIAELLRGAQQGRFGGLDKSPSERTDFSEMTATFDIAKGVATNKDLRMVSPLLRIGGAGTINIGRRTLDYLAKPKLVASLTGQGAQGAEDGLVIPVRVVGPWAKPSIRPELGDALQNVLQNPEQLEQKARQLRDRFRGKKTGEVVDDLLKDNGRGAKELLRGIFGGQ
ncbi:MAG: AsmA family protein [Pseudomonadota bacterium]